MPKNATFTKRTNWKLFCFIVALTLAMPAGQLATAQDPVEAGQQALKKKRFPWLESGTESFAELDRKDPGQAKSINRRDLPEHVSSPTPTTAPNPNAWSWMPVLSGFVWFLIGVLLLLIVGLLVWFFLKMESRTGTNFETDGETEELVRERIKQLPFEVQQTPTGNFRDRAWQSAQQGDFGRATMLLFSHILLHLDHKGLIRLRKGKTNRQYLQELKQHSQVSNYFRRVMVPFEDTFFGDHAISPRVFDACWNDLEIFHERVNECRQVELP